MRDDISQLQSWGNAKLAVMMSEPLAAVFESELDGDTLVSKVTEVTDDQIQKQIGDDDTPIDQDIQLDISPVVGVDVDELKKNIEIDPLDFKRNKRLKSIEKKLREREKRVQKLREKKEKEA